MVSPPFRPTAFAFDMDGLLVDSEPLWFESERAFAATRGADWTFEHAANSKGVGIASTIQRMHSLFGFPIDIEADSAWIVSRFIDHVGGLSLKPGALEMLFHAKTSPRALASSSCRRLIDATLHRFGLEGEFQAIVSGDDVARLKPAPDIFLLAAARLGVDPSECLALEDSLSGTEAAKAAGMTVISVPEFSPPHARFFELADAVVSSLIEARELIVIADHGLSR